VTGPIEVPVRSRAPHEVRWRVVASALLAATVVSGCSSRTGRLRRRCHAIDTVGRLDLGRMSMNWSLLRSMNDAR
jgi:hypothetical protein